MDARSSYFKYKLIVVVFECHRSKEAAGLAIFKKKSMGKVGPVPMGQRFQIIIVESWMHFEA